MKLRHVLVGDQSWGYTIGTSAAVIVAPNGQKTTVFLHTLTGRDPNIIERGRYKRTSDGAVLPSEVKRYIERHAKELLLPAPRPLGKGARQVLHMASDRDGIPTLQLDSRSQNKALDSLVARGLVAVKMQHALVDGERKRIQIARLTPEGQSILRRLGSPRARGR